MSFEFYTMAAVSLSMLIHGLISYQRIWQAPTWIGFIFVAFLIPQAIYIENTGLYDRFNAGVAWLYITACLLSFWAGFGLTSARISIEAVPLNLRLIEERLKGRGIVILLLGTFSMFKVNEIAAASELGAQWTGVITLYYLLFQMVFYSICLFFIMYLISRKPKYLWFFIFALSLALVAIAFNAKRSLMSEIVFIIGISLFCIKGTRVPRSVVAGLMMVGIVLVHQIGTVRDYIEEGQGNAYQAIITGVPFAGFEYFNPKKAPELTQGVVDIYISNTKGYHYGPAFIWNRMVHQYVPAFLVGYGLKESLKIDIGGIYDLASEYDWYGATRTGFSDSFLGFWYFGIFLYAIIGALMGYLFIFAKGGHLWAVFLYSLLLNDAMFTVTESTARFFSGGFFVAVVGAFLFYFTKNQRQALMVRQRKMFHLRSSS